MVQPPFNLNVKTNVTHISLQQTSYKNSLTVTLSKSVTAALKIQNISQIIKGHDNKVKQIKRHHQLNYNWRIKTERPLNGDCHKENVTYKCTASITFQPKKVYLGLAEGEFKKQKYHNHTQSFRNGVYSNSTTLSSYVLKIMKTKK